MISIRKSKIDDLDKILKIYEIARNFMKESGNPTQWGDNYPDKTLVKEDIENEISYVVENSGIICAVFVFFIGKEQSYEDFIKENQEYGIIHRVASDGSIKGIVSEVYNFAKNKISDIKIDTHKDNSSMQRVLEKLGFKKSGIIYLKNGSERILYQSSTMIRHVVINDLDKLAKIEADSYPESEAASRESIRKRIESFPECFWILEEGGNILSFINGMSTDEKELEDRMYDDAKLHDSNGKWQMIFSVVTAKEFRNAGNASKVMRKVIEDCKLRKKAGIVLTCKEELRGFYKSFGYKEEGISDSKHGNTLWYKMRLTL